MNDHEQPHSVPFGSTRSNRVKTRPYYFLFSGVHKYHGYVPGIILLQVIRDGIPQLVSTVPLRTGTAAVHVLFCFLPSRRSL